MADCSTVSIVDKACPHCGPNRQALYNRVRKVRREWHKADKSYSWYCARCGSKGASHRSGSVGVWGSNKAPASTLQHASRSVDNESRRKTAVHLWKKSIRASGTPVAQYLESRGIVCDIPDTIRYLPSFAGHQHAMITAIGVAEEIECGRYVISANQIAGVHLTRLNPGGNGKLTGENVPAKIMIGPSKGHPIMLFPPNDGLGLCIAEGIENALTAHLVTGLGAIAAGAANRMPGMARHVPNYVECVTIIPDCDPVGLQYAKILLKALSCRDIGLSFAVSEIYGG